MKTRHSLLKGTLILTLTGLVSRIIGFFYRIFLSRTIGAEGMGIYQLIFPVYVMCFSFTSAGIETTISKFVASKLSVNDKKSARDILYMGLFLSFSLAILSSYILLTHSEFIAVNLLEEPRCAPLLIVLAFAIPFCSIHSCITGYYYGLKQAAIPAFMQLMEQIVRVTSVYIICSIYTEKGLGITPKIAVYGIVFGELCSMFISICSVASHFHRLKIPKTRKLSMLYHLKSIITMSLPLTCNKVLINLLQSVEAVLIPSMLRRYGLTTSESLSIYGILTGMALPLILFPSAITNSVSVMLLPEVASAHATEHTKRIQNIIEDTIKYCMILGILCTGGFLLYGSLMGNILFGNELVGQFIITLAWICPFLYLTTTLNSILHGLGKSVIAFFNNTLGLGIRIFFVVCMIPIYGITGYLWGVLVSQLTITLLSLFVLYKNIKLNFPVNNWIVKPFLSLAFAAFISRGTNRFLLLFPFINELTAAVLSGLILCFFYGAALLFTGAIHLKRNK